MTAEEHAAIVNQLVDNCRRAIEHPRNENWNNYQHLLYYNYPSAFSDQGRFAESTINYARNITRNEYSVYRRDKIYPEMKFLKT